MNWDKIITVSTIVAIVLLILLLIGGCCQAYKAKIVELTQQLEDASSNPGTKVMYKQDWLVTLSVIGIGLSVFAFLQGHLWGVKAIAALLVVLSTVFMCARFAAWMAVITLVGAVGVAGWAIWVNRRALKEIIAGGERFKLMVSAPVSSTAGDVMTPDILFKEAHNGEQSPATVRIVSMVQKKLNGKNGKEQNNG